MSDAENILPKINRYITTHDASGKAILSKEIPTEAKWQHFEGNDKREASFFLAYATHKFPIDLSTPATASPSSSPPTDISTYTSYLSSPPGLSLSNGSVLRFVDIAPGHSSPMHRTVSLDYGVVLEGEVELLLDSGERVVLKRGDVAVQRATAHAWRNVSEVCWCRLLFVLLPCTALEVGGVKLEEDLGNMRGVRSSD